MESTLDGDEGVRLPRDRTSRPSPRRASRPTALLIRGGSRAARRPARQYTGRAVFAGLLANVRPGHARGDPQGGGTDRRRRRSHAADPLRAAARGRPLRPSRTGSSPRASSRSARSSSVAPTTRVASLTDEERARGVVSHSSGNHAQGVARAGRLLGTHVIVVMPTARPQLKVERVLADGAEIVFVGPDPDERAARAHELSEQRGLVLIPQLRRPPDHRRAGNRRPRDRRAGVRRRCAAIAPEGTPFTVLVPVGGGGLIGGIATAVKALRPDARVIRRRAGAGRGRERVASDRGSCGPGQRTEPAGPSPTASGRRSLSELTFAHRHGARGRHAHRRRGRDRGRHGGGGGPDHASCSSRRARSRSPRGSSTVPSFLQTDR